MVDPGETPMAAAVRELAEETGYTGGVWQELGTVSPNRRSTPTGCTRSTPTTWSSPRSPPLEDGEHLTVDTATLDEIQAKLLVGEIEHASSSSPSATRVPAVPAREDRRGLSV